MGIEQASTYMTNNTINVATPPMPQTLGRLPRQLKPWWTSERMDTRKLQNRTRGIFRQYAIVDNLISSKEACAKVRWMQGQAKSESWKNFVLSLNTNTRSKIIWDRLRKIEGNYG